MELSSKILSDLVVFMKYAKYIPELQRREVWTESVDRNKNMHLKKYPDLEDEIEEAYKFVYEKKVLPSMRSMQFGGRAIEVNNARMYNCCLLPIDHHLAFSEIMFLLLSGTGVGFSIQKHHIEKLPEIAKPHKNNSQRFLVADSIEGWADAIKALVKSYFYGKVKYDFDYSDIRSKGERLVTSGGKAPGHEPLKSCIERMTKLFERKNDGEKLNSREVYDLVCYIADAVLVGGIRRAALICFFTKDDNLLINAKHSNIPANILSKEYAIKTTKDGIVDDTDKILLTIETEGVVYENVAIYKDEKSGKFWDLEQHSFDGTFGWWVANPQRARSNNSGVFIRDNEEYSVNSSINKEFFDMYFDNIVETRSGEPAIYQTNDTEWLSNPCVEIGLRLYQFCNLTEINGGNIESQEDFNQRARIAAFIGTLQASYTNFHYLRNIWKTTTIKDSLLGVGITGIGNGVILQYNETEAAKEVLKENERVAKILNINIAARTTCVKPSGTTSLVLGCSSGIHGWHDHYYIRRMRVNKNEAIYSYFLIHHPDLIEDDKEKPETSAVISIPQKAPKTAIIRNEGALSLLERVKRYSNNWVKTGHRNGKNTHNVSVTVSVQDNEWNDVKEWMWENRDCYNGVSLLPYDNGTYIQAPYESCSEKVYNEMFSKLTEIDLTKVIEIEDNTSLLDQSACASGGCELT